MLPKLAHVESVQYLQTGALAAAHWRTVQPALVHSHLPDEHWSSTEQLVAFGWGAKQRSV
jgi:hypothetical protein